MQIARFEAAGRISWGVVESPGLVREIPAHDFPSLAAGLMTPGGPRTDKGTHRLEEVRMLAPCLPSKIFALAHNYRDHLQGKPEPREPQIFLKVPSSVINPGDTIVLPAGQGRVDEEAELVVVMGKRCRGASREEALSCVLGYTCGNDVSARVWQKNDLNWWRAKSSDTFSPLGPVITVGMNPREALITGRINGREVQRCRPVDLIFDIPALIQWISRWVTLEPGDLIFTGTSGDPAELHAGDSVEVEIEGIGVLSNTVAAGT